MCKETMKKVSLFLFLFSFSIYSLAGEARLQHEGLVIIAKYESNSVEKPNNSNFLYGEIQIRNSALTTENYGNSNLFLIIDNLKSRTYLDTIASVEIDFSSITIQPNETIKLNVYWAFNQPVTIKDKTVSLLWKE